MNFSKLFSFLFLPFQRFFELDGERVDLIFLRREFVVHPSQMLGHHAAWTKGSVALKNEISSQ